MPFAMPSTLQSSRFPNELLSKIFAETDPNPADLQRYARVCRKFKEAQDTRPLWRTFLEPVKTGDGYDAPMLPATRSPRTQFVSEYQLQPPQTQLIMRHAYRRDTGWLDLDLIAEAKGCFHASRAIVEASPNTYNSFDDHIQGHGPLILRILCGPQGSQNLIAKHWLKKLYQDNQQIAYLAAENSAWYYLPCFNNNILSSPTFALFAINHGADLEQLPETLHRDKLLATQYVKRNGIDAYCLLKDDLQKDTDIMKLAVVDSTGEIDPFALDRIHTDFHKTPETIIWMESKIAAKQSDILASHGEENAHKWREMVDFILAERIP